MQPLLNTLYVTRDGAYLRKDHERIVVEQEGENIAELPLLHVGSLVVFGRTMLSPHLIDWCCQNGRTISRLTAYGRFIGRVVGPQSGNILLRMDQYEHATTPHLSTRLARNLIAGKLQNARLSVLRSRRQADEDEDVHRLEETAREIGRTVRYLPRARNVEAIRGLEGTAARAYFAGFPCMIRQNRSGFPFDGRVKHPPTDRLNSLLSFLYTLLLHDCIAGAESVGLDPQMGFLHTPRPGRPSLALDLMEELRPLLGDRVALTLINRQQIKPESFQERQGGSYRLTDHARKTVLQTYQDRKRDEVTHPVLDRQVPLGLLPHLQARLLARTLRGDLDEYPPFTLV